MIATALAGACRLWTGTSVQWRCDPDGDAPRIYFANHSSHLDFVVIWSALPPRLRRRTRPVAGLDYWGQGAIRRYLADRVFHAALIERRQPGSAPGPAEAQATIARLAEALGDHGSLIVFPEGTRSLSGAVGPFKSGLYHLSRLRPDVELIPVWLQNLNRILPKGEALPVPMLSGVVFGARLETSADEDTHVFLERARQAVIELGD